MTINDFDESIDITVITEDHVRIASMTCKGCISHVVAAIRWITLAVFFCRDSSRAAEDGVGPVRPQVVIHLLLIGVTEAEQARAAANEVILA